jgi:hypothetical protein
LVPAAQQHANSAGAALAEDRLRGQEVEESEKQESTKAGSKHGSGCCNSYNGNSKLLPQPLRQNKKRYPYITSPLCQGSGCQPGLAQAARLVALPAAHGWPATPPPAVGSAPQVLQQL